MSEARRQPPFLLSFVSLLRKDCRALWKARSLLFGVFGFALLLVVVSSFAFLYLGMSDLDKLNVTPGIIWLIFIFTSVLALNQSFLFEKENDAHLAIVLSPVSSTAFYLSKCLSNALFICSVQLLVFVCHEVFFGVELVRHLISLSCILVLSAGAFSAIGTLLSAIAVSVKGRELVLPLLLFPLAIPVLSAAVSLTRTLLSTGMLDYSDFWFWFLFCANSIPLALGALLFDYVIRD